MAASSSFHLGAQASGVKYSIASGGSVTVALDSTDGVRTVQWSSAAVDDSGTAWTITSPTATSTNITAPSGSGKAMLLKCQVNGDPELISYALIYIAPEVMVVGETTESDATNGWVAKINAAIRATGGSGSPTFQSLTVSDTDASLTIARSAANAIAMSGGSGDSIEIDSAANITLDVGSTGVLVLNEAETERLRITTSAAASIQALGNSLAVYGFSSLLLYSSGFVQISTAPLLIATQLRFDGVISPTSLSANADDYNPASLSTANTIRQDASANVNITGIQGGAEGRILVIHNISAANTISLTHDDAASTAANRFYTPSAATLTIPVGGCATIQYDNTSSRWRVMSKNF